MSNQTMQENDEVIFEGRIRYSKNVLADIVALANENPLSKTSIMKIVGRVQLSEDGGYVVVTYTGRRDIARRLEIYADMLNYDGSHEAMMAALKFKLGGQK